MARKNKSNKRNSSRQNSADRQNTGNRSYPLGRGNVPSMARAVMAQIISSFLSLSQPTQQEVLRTLVAIHTSATAQNVENRVPETPRPEPKPVEEKKTSPKSTKVQGWDKPFVKGLIASEWLRAASKTERISETGKQHLNTLSSALAAAARAVREKVPEQEIEERIIASQHSQELLRALWSRDAKSSSADTQNLGNDAENSQQRSIVPVQGSTGIIQISDILREWAESSPPHTRLAIGSELSFTTDIVALGNPVSELTSLRLEDFPYHRPGVPLDVGSRGADRILQQRDYGDYSNLSRYLFRRPSDQAVVLLRYPGTWGDQCDDSDLSSPETKKRKREHSPPRTPPPEVPRKVREPGAASVPFATPPPPPVETPPGKPGKKSNKKEKKEKEKKKKDKR